MRPGFGPIFRPEPYLGRAFTFLLALAIVLSLACVSEVGRDEPVATEPATSVGRPTSPPTTQAPTATVPTPTPTESPGLFLQVRAPADGSSVPGSAVVVHGLTNPGAAVDVNGSAAAIDSNGGFRAEAELEPGINTVVVVATDGPGNQETVSLNVTSLALPPQPFLLLISEPEDQSVLSDPLLRISGRTGPEAIASVNGVSVDVDLFGGFFTTVSLEPGPNIIDVVATNDDGQVLSTVIAVIYRPTGG